MLTRITESTRSLVGHAAPAEQVRVKLFGVSIYRSVVEVNRLGRRVWMLGVPVYRARRIGN